MKPVCLWWLAVLISDVLKCSVQQWTPVVERLLQQASELLSLSDHAKLDSISEKSQNLRTTNEQFWDLMMCRLGHLHESNSFFNSANKVRERGSKMQLELPLMALMTWLFELVVQYTWIITDSKLKRLWVSWWRKKKHPCYASSIN